MDKIGVIIGVNRGFHSPSVGGGDWWWGGEK